MGSISRAGGSRDRVRYASLATSSKGPFHGEWTKGCVQWVLGESPGKGHSTVRKSRLLWDFLQ